MTAPAGRITIMVTENGRTYPVLSVPVLAGTFHVSALVRVGKVPEAEVRMVSRPSWLDRLVARLGRL